MSQQPTWNFGRFMKTLSYFGAVPFLSEMDWFQQWFGSRPNPNVNSALLTDPVADTDPSLSIAAIDQSAQANAVLVLASQSLAQPLGQQLLAQGRRVRVVVPTGDRTGLPALAEGLEAIEIDASGHLPAQAIDSLVAGIVDSEAIDDQQLKPLVAALGDLGLSHRTLFDFRQPSQDLKEVWGALDDVVMGGVSESNIRFDNSIAYFSGVVSTANSGGFASVRTRNFEPSLDLSEYDGIELRVKGDGNRYKFMLRSETRWDGIAYCYSFDTVPDEWITLHIPFTAMIPVFRAKTVQTGAIDQRHICATQLMLSKFEYDGGLNPHFEPGFFQLQIESIRAYRQSALPKFILLSRLEGAAADREAQEAIVRQSGIPYTIIRLNSSGTTAAQSSHNPTDTVSAPLSDDAIAGLCLQALQQPKARNATFTAAPGHGDGAALLDTLQPDR